MAIVDLKSNLSQILPFKQEQQRILQQARDREGSVNYFPNTNMTGFTINRGNAGLETEYKLNDNGSPIIPQTSYTDIKGDFVSLYSPTNPAFPNKYNTDNAPTPLQSFELPRSNPVDRDGAFLAPFSVTNPYTFSGASIAQFHGFGVTGVFTNNTKLLNLHNQGRQTEVANAGFTRRALPLQKYYAQSGVDTGIFGQRNDGLSKGNEPKIIRNIGQRWNSEFDIPFVPDFVNAGLDALGSIASPAFGRDISTFTNRYKADTVRIGDFANPISTYYIKQQYLHQQNKYDKVASRLYGLNQPVQTAESKFGNLLSLTTSNALEINPQEFNPLSTFSIPGVIHINRHATNIGSVVGGAAAGGFAIGIATQISLRALQAAAPVAAKFISKGLGSLASGAGSMLSGLGGAIGGKLGGIGGGLNLPSLGGGGGLGSFGLPSINLPNINFPSVNLPTFSTGINIGDTIGKIADSKVGIGIQGGLMDAGKLLRRVGHEGKKLVEAGKTLIDDVGVISKEFASQLDPRAFEDMKVDRVNLIPYGSTEYEGISYTKLDLIPFRFEDARNGNSIVFRAILSGITDTFSPEYSPTRFVGRPDNVYTYQGTNRSISFTFDVYPKSDTEMVTLWEKMNALAGLTYPHIDDSGAGMIAPYSKLTIGGMYDNAPGLISSLSYTVQDNTTWEVDFAKLPKYIKAQVTFIYIGNRLPTATQKHFDCAWIAPEEIVPDDNSPRAYIENVLKEKFAGKSPELPKIPNTKSILGSVGL